MFLRLICFTLCLCRNVMPSFAMDKSFGWLTWGTMEYIGRQTRKSKMLLCIPSIEFLLMASEQ